MTDPRDTEREEEDRYSLADAITVPSQFAARSFVDQGVSANKVHVIPYGVRLENFRQTSPPPTGGFQVLFAGAVGLRKGFPYLLEAFSKVRHPASCCGLQAQFSLRSGVCWTAFPGTKWSFWVLSDRNGWPS